MWSTATPSEHTRAQTGQPATAHEAPDDRRLPRLGFALDTTLMLTVLGAALLDGEQLRQRFQLLGCAIDQIRYKPGTSCMISYRLTLRDKQTGQELVQLCCARMLQSGGSASRFRKAQLQPLVAPPVGRPLLHIPELDMVVWNFPNDRKLAGLPALVDRASLRGAILPPIVAATWGDRWTIAELNSEPVHYVAEHTFTLRARLGLVEAGSGVTQAATLYGKVYGDDQGAAAYGRMQQLWHSAARRSGRLLMAQPLGYQADQRLLWQRGLDGTPMLEHDAHSAAWDELLSQAAAAVAALHTSTIVGTHVVASADILHTLHRAARLVALARPSCAEALGRLVERLSTQARELGERPQAVLHGDLHLKNFMVLPRGVALIDLDTLCAGDPLRDLGSFVAGLYVRGLLEPPSLPAVEQRVERFVQAYERQVGLAVAEADLNWHIAAALIGERAARCITRLKAGRLAMVERIVELADRISRCQAAAVAP